LKWPAIPAKQLPKSPASSRAFAFFFEGAPAAHRDIVGELPADAIIASRLKACSMSSAREWPSPSGVGLA
jgi:hypothetical protein